VSTEIVLHGWHMSPPYLPKQFAACYLCSVATLYTVAMTESQPRCMFMVYISRPIQSALRQRYKPYTGGADTARLPLRDSSRCFRFAYDRLTMASRVFSVPSSAASGMTSSSSTLGWG
jgi:hypothetical protein